MSTISKNRYPSQTLEEATAKPFTPANTYHSNVAFKGRQFEQGLMTLSAISPSSKGNNIGVGIETAQCLLDPRRQLQLKASLQKQFPLLPSFVLDVCIDQAAVGLQAVAPAKLQAALKPGGMAKLKPQIEQAMIDSILQQQMVKDMSLIGDKEKKKLVHVVVNKAMDYLLADLQDVLAAPEERLQKLDEERRKVLQFMTPWQVTCYQVKYHFRTIVATAGLIAIYTQRDLFVQGYVRLSDFMMTLLAAVKKLGGHKFSSRPRKWQKSAW